MARKQLIIATGRRRRSLHTEEAGISALEFLFVSVLLFLMTFALIDVARYFYARTVIQDALVYAIKRAQSEFNTVVEFDALNSSSHDYQNYGYVHDAIIGEADGKLEGIKSMVRFYEARDLDDMADGMHMREPKSVAYLLPGKAAMISDPVSPGGRLRMIQNRNMCWQRAGRPIARGGVEFFAADSIDWCLAGVYRHKQSYKSLTKIYPLELVVTARFNGIIARNLIMSVRAAGFLPEHTDGPTTISEAPTTALTIP